MWRHNHGVVDLESVYRQTLSRCAPDVLIHGVVTSDAPRDVVAIGKCAGALLDGLDSVLTVRRALAILPHGYPAPRAAVEVTVLRGGHPHMDDHSFDAGEQLLNFADRHDEITFLISGGGSACVEHPLQPWFTRSDLIEVNSRLIAAGLPIDQINTVRKHLSAIKGGRLAARVTRRSVTFLYSDVATGDLSAVASGPTLPDSTTKEQAIEILLRVGGCDRIVTILRDGSVPETVKTIANSTATLVADNRTLTRTAAAILNEDGVPTVEEEAQIEGDVAAAAELLVARAKALRPGEVYVTGGEPTVVQRGSGRGGRCSELAVRFAHGLGQLTNAKFAALFGSSDGVDGNSGVAGIVLDKLPVAIDSDFVAASLENSDSFTVAGQIGRPIIIPPTGNNLRDLYLVARG